LAAVGEFTPVVRRLACLRGASTLTRFTLAVEIGDRHRFTGKSLGSFVGEYSSGASRSHGSINKTATAICAGLLLRRPDTTAPDTRSVRPCSTAGTWPRPLYISTATKATRAFAGGG
jgi:transposase